MTTREPPRDVRRSEVEAKVRRCNDELVRRMAVGLRAGSPEARSTDRASDLIRLAVKRLSRNTLGDDADADLYADRASKELWPDENASASTPR